MNKENDLQYYLSISPNKFGIYLFDTKELRNLYKEEITLNYNSDSFNLDSLKNFLDNNIFKIEKLSGKFLKDIFLILEDKRIFNLEMGIKQKNYNTLITTQNLKNLLIEAKNIFRENYQDEEIIHMIINKYLINDNSYLSLEENLRCDHLALEIHFKSISNNLAYDLNKILENYQIKIIKYIDGSYVKSNFQNDLELSEMSYRILSGYNQNEVIFVTKSTKKLAFFEKFFQLFS